MDAVTLPATSSGIFTVPTSFQTASDPLEAVYKKHKHFRPLSELMSSALGSFEEPSQADLAEAKRVGLENLEERARRWGTVADELYATWSQERLDKGRLFPKKPMKLANIYRFITRDPYRQQSSSSV